MEIASQEEKTFQLNSMDCFGHACKHGMAWHQHKTYESKNQNSKPLENSSLARAIHETVIYVIYSYSTQNKGKHVRGAGREIRATHELLCNIVIESCCHHFRCCRRAWVYNNVHFNTLLAISALSPQMNFNSTIFKILIPEGAELMEEKKVFFSPPSFLIILSEDFFPMERNSSSLSNWIFS